MARNFNPRREITSDQIEQSLKNRKLGRSYLCNKSKIHFCEVKKDSVPTLIDDNESSNLKSVAIVRLGMKSKLRTRRFSYRDSMLVKSEIKK